MPTISDMFASVPGVRQDWKEDWVEDAKQDWRADWDNIPGDAPGAAPANTALPVVSGDVVVGETLSVTAGTWTGNPAPTISYKWFVDGAEVVGETSNSYVIQSSDEGLMVSVEVTATNSEGSAAEEVSVGQVNAQPANTALPVISGTIQVGETLTVSDGTWTGFPAPTISYQWFVDGAEVVGETSNSYVIQASDAGLMVSVEVTATNTEGSASESVAVGPVNAQPANTVLPVISGTIQVGETLTVSDGTWTGFPVPTISYSWFFSADGTPGSYTPTGVTTVDYVVQPGEEAGFLLAQVTADNGVGTPVISETVPVGPVVLAA